MGLAEKDGVKAGQIWELQNGIGRKPSLCVVTSISRYFVDRSGHRVYLTNIKTGKASNRSLTSLLKGVGCRRIS